MRKYCAYQERCESEIRTKMERFNIKSSDKDIIIKTLRAEKFVDDQRYANSFVKGKMNANKWGRIKIRYALRQKRISDDAIDLAMDSIEEEDYKSLIQDLAVKKMNKIKGEYSDYEKRQKTAVYLQSKGFETDLIFKIVNKIT